MLVKTTSLFRSFEFIKASIIGTLWFLLKNWCSYNTAVRKLWKKLWKTSIFKSLSVTKFICNMHFLCATKNCPPQAVGKDWFQSAREILGWNLMVMWLNKYFSKFGSEIPWWLRIPGISFFTWYFNFLQMSWLYSSINKKSVI